MGAGPWRWRLVRMEILQLSGKLRPPSIHFWG